MLCCLAIIQGGRFYLKDRLEALCFWIGWELGEGQRWKAAERPAKSVPVSLSRAQCTLKETAKDAISDLFI